MNRRHTYPQTDKVLEGNQLTNKDGWGRSHRCMESDVTAKGRSLFLASGGSFYDEKVEHEGIFLGRGAAGGKGFG